MALVVYTKTKLSVIITTTSLTNLLSSHQGRSANINVTLMNGYDIEWTAVAQTYKNIGCRWFCDIDFSSI